MIYLVAGGLPTIAIYYFTKGNWPLPFWLQLSLFIILLLGYVILSYYSLSGSNGGGGRHSNPIGAAGAIHVFIILLAPLIIGVGIVAFHYKNIPIGDPGILVQPIKWGFIFILLLSISLFTYYIVNNNLLTKLYLLPNFIKMPIYTALVKKDLSSAKNDQLYKTLQGEIQSKNNIDPILLLTKKERLLINLLIHQRTSEYREQVLTTHCQNITETKYPSKYMLKIIISRVSEPSSSPFKVEKEENVDPGVLLTTLSCMKKSGFNENLSSHYIYDIKLLEKIWTNYPQYRSYYLPGNKSVAEQFFRNRIINNDNISADLDKMINKLTQPSNYKKHANFMLQYLITNIPKTFDESNDIIFNLAKQNIEAGYELIYENRFPDSAWKIIKYNNDLLNRFTGDNDIRNKLVHNKNISEKYKKETYQIIKFILYLKEKGMTTLYHTSKYDVTAKLLKEKYGSEGFIDAIK